MKFDNNFQVESYFFQRKLNHRKWNKNIFHWITKVCFIIFCIWGIDWCHLFSWVHCCYSVKLCPSHSDPMNCSAPRFPVLRPISKFAQTHVHWVSDAIQPSHPLLSPSSAFNCSQHQSPFHLSQLFASGGQSIGASEYHQSFQWIFRFISFRIDWFYLIIQGTLKSLLQHHNSKASIFGAQLSLWFNSHIHTWLLENHSITRWTFVGKVMSLLFNICLSLSVIVFLPRSKRLLISWLPSPSAVILEPKKIKPVTVSTFSPSVCHELTGLDAMILVFWMLSFKLTFSLSSSTLIKWFFSSFLLSTINMVLSAYMRLLIFPPGFIPNLYFIPSLHLYWKHMTGNNKWISRPNFSFFPPLKRSHFRICLNILRFLDSRTLNL